MPWAGALGIGEGAGGAQGVQGDALWAWHQRLVRQRGGACLWFASGGEFVLSATSTS